MTDVPWWVLAGPYAGLAGSILGLALWFFRLRHSLAEKGWKHTSRVWVLFPIFILTDSVRRLLIALQVIQIVDRTETALQYTFAALGWIILAIMVAGMMLDAWRRTRQST
ncbi:hypothetical protein AUG86_00200 [Euryarchaeota archaeon 13_1_20CM_4_64_14]|nr:MAG: hypothetical protein AUG86_00200 [Euryarchaeota archaeon 13_1_20CM_4_64_14]